MNSIVAGVLVLGLIAMAIGLAMLYLQGKALEGMIGDVVRIADSADSRAQEIQGKVDHLITRGKRGPKKKAATVTPIASNVG